MDIGEKLGAEAAGLVKTEVLGAWTHRKQAHFHTGAPNAPSHFAGKAFRPLTYIAAP